MRTIFSFFVSASQLGKGLDEQLARFVAEHTDTKLIIIDTLQKVREVGGDNYSYANDYQIMISSWEGSATELVSLIKVEIQPHVITRKLNVLSGRLYAEHGIYYKSNRTHDGRKIRFWKDDTETA